MKDQFIEKCGLLFMKCEPEPMQQDSPTPCIVQFVQDDSPMGLYNKHTQLSDKRYICREIQESGTMILACTINAHYSRLNIVAKHCPEGSREWALWQIMQGNSIHNNSAEHNIIVEPYDDTMVKETHGHTYYWQLYESWLWTSPKTGWQIYEEPEPEFEIGKWYWNKVHKEYCYAIERDDDVVEMRSAGTLSTYFYDLMEVDDLVEASIEPDFSNAKVGDEVFAVARGTTSIREIRKKPYPIRTKTYSFTKCGRHMDTDKHPILFHSVAQCAAYFAEVALKDGGE